MPSLLNKGARTAEGLRVFLFRVSFASPDCQFFILYSPQSLGGSVRLLYLQVFRIFPHVIFICLHSEFSITEGKASFGRRAEVLLLVPPFPSHILPVIFLCISTPHTDS